MESNKIIFSAIFIFMLNADGSRLQQYLLLTGGTNGIGVKYSLWSDILSIEAGIPFKYRFQKNYEGNVYTKNEVIFDQYFSMQIAFLSKKTVVLSIGIIEFNSMGYSHIQYENDSLGFANYYSLDNRLGITFDYTNQLKMKKRFGIQITPFSISIRKGRRNLETILQFNYFFRYIGKKNKL